MTKKTLIAITAVVLVLFCTVGATLAWLVANTSEVTNTFTYGDINITLDETTTSYKMIPGYTIAKDPKVTVTANSEACYLFVKIEESTNFSTFMEYKVAADWEQLTGVTGVYYRRVGTSPSAQDFAVLKDNQVKVGSEVTKAQFDDLTDTTKPTLTFTAYACQRYKASGSEFTPAEAWAIVNNGGKTPTT